jgi:hypothetical protein
MYMDLLWLSIPNIYIYIYIYICTCIICIYIYVYIYMTNGRNHPADLKFDHPSVGVYADVYHRNYGLF